MGGYEEIIVFTEWYPFLLPFRIFSLQVVLDFSECVNFLRQFGELLRLLLVSDFNLMILADVLLFVAQHSLHTIKELFGLSFHLYDIHFSGNVADYFSFVS